MKEQFLKWATAQKHERTHHPAPFNPNLDDRNSQVYYKFYKNYLRFTGLSFDLEGQSVLEVGPAKIAGLFFCKNYGQSYLVEPLVFEDTLQFCSDKGITMIHQPIETCVLPKVNQAWMFNLLQHVIDPATVVEKLKECADTIHFFEPIDVRTDEKHIHSPTEDFFIEAFGRNVVKRFYGMTIPGFHRVDCSYGKFVVNE